MKIIKNNLEFKNKKVLLMGLGILGGGLNLAKWLVKNGAELTITDLKSRAELEKSIKQLDYKKIKFVLGKHREKDFIENEIIVLNQDILPSNKFVQLAVQQHKIIADELTLFYQFSPTRNIIGVTGTRGKTTTANWIAHLLKPQYPQIKVLGNSPENSLIDQMNLLKANQPVVLEIPSCLLEESNQVQFAPHIAVITNLYQDHLNRYKSGLSEYAQIKANIFIHQKKSDWLILNYHNFWTKFFLNLKPMSQILFFSTSTLPKNLNGIFVKDFKVYFRHKQVEKFIFDARDFVLAQGQHNLENLFPAILCALRYKLSFKKINQAIKTLPVIKFRQELVYQDKQLEIYNDTAATSPEATIAAVKKFSSREGDLILITGGTDKELDFSVWAKDLKKILKPSDIIFLSGSATQKMKKVLDWTKINEYDKLEDCLKAAFKKIKFNKNKSQLLFSPASKSFEKFKNEFDRGEQFNKLIKKYI